MPSPTRARARSPSASRPWVPPDQGSHARDRSRKSRVEDAPALRAWTFLVAGSASERVDGETRKRLAFGYRARSVRTLAIARAPCEARARRTPRSLVSRDTGCHARGRGEARTRARALTRGDRDLHGERHASHFDVWVVLCGSVNACADMPRQVAARGLRPLSLVASWTSAISPPFRAFDWPKDSATDRGRVLDSEIGRLWSRERPEIPDCLPPEKPRQDRYLSRCVTPESRFVRARLGELAGCVVTRTGHDRGGREKRASPRRTRARHFEARRRHISAFRSQPRRRATARHHRRLRGNKKDSPPSSIPEKSHLAWRDEAKKKQQRTVPRTSSMASRDAHDMAAPRVSGKPSPQPKWRAVLDRMAANPLDAGSRHLETRPIGSALSVKTVRGPDRTMLGRAGRPKLLTAGHDPTIETALDELRAYECEKSEARAARSARRASEKARLAAGVAEARSNAKRDREDTKRGKEASTRRASAQSGTPPWLH